MKKKKNDLSGKPIVFFGTPKFAVDVLNELEAAGIVPAVIVTVPDKPAGRGLELKQPETKVWGLEREIAVIQPTSLTREDPAMDIIYNSWWELFIVAAYGKIIPFEILKRPHSGSLNVHPSLLPKYRGPSPIESQILADDKETGVSIMLLDEELDHGPIIAQASITPEEWPLPRRMLEELLAQEGGKLLAEVVPTWIDEFGLDSVSWEEGYNPTLQPEPQDHTKATFTKKIEKSDGLISLTDDGYQNYLKYCAYDEWPGTYFFIEKDGEKRRVRIEEASYENGTFTIERVVPEGKKEMDYESFLRGI